MHLVRARLTALLLVPLATCSGPPTVEGMPEHVDYVAMGDSFSAGGWIDDSSSDPLGCVRSSNNYPAFLASWLQVMSFTDRTCGGASTLDLTGDQGLADGSGVRPQLEAVSEETDLVTVGIGVNDFGLYAEMVGCLSERPTSRCADGSGRLLVQSATRVEARLVDVLMKTRDAAPDARVLLIGYPRLLPGAHGCAELPVDEDTATWVHRAEEQLDRSMRSARDGGRGGVPGPGRAVGRPRRLLRRPGMGQRLAPRVGRRSSVPPQPAGHARGRRGALPGPHRGEAAGRPDRGAVGLRRPSARR